MGEMDAMPWSIEDRYGTYFPSSSTTYPDCRSNRRGNHTMHAPNAPNENWSSVILTSTRLNHEIGTMASPPLAKPSHSE